MLPGVRPGFATVRNLHRGVPAERRSTAPDGVNETQIEPRCRSAGGSAGRLVEGPHEPGLLAGDATSPAEMTRDEHPALVEARLALVRRPAIPRQDAGYTQAQAARRISCSAVASAEAAGVCSRDFCHLVGQLYGPGTSLPTSITASRLSRRQPTARRPSKPGRCARQEAAGDCGTRCGSSGHDRQCEEAGAGPGRPDWRHCRRRGVRGGGCGLAGWLAPCSSALAFTSHQSSSDS